MKILLADADSDLAGILSYLLLRHGHTVVTVAEVEQAWHRWRSEQPEMTMLDTALPGGGGFELCRRIREISQQPLVVLSALGNESDVVRAYECGADDFIIKPFSPRQLLLRLEALMRRFNGGNDRTHEPRNSRVLLGDLEIDPSAHEVRKNSLRLPMTRLEFRILAYLAQNAGALVEAGRLAEYAWQSPENGDAALLKTHVSHIRQKLADAGGNSIQIRAVPRTGYILTLATAPVATPELAATS